MRARNFGSVDILVNNAAVILSKDILETTEEEWDDVMAVNVKGAFHHVRSGLPDNDRKEEWRDRKRDLHLRRRRAGETGRVLRFEGSTGADYSPALDRICGEGNPG